MLVGSLYLIRIPYMHFRMNASMLQAGCEAVRKREVFGFKPFGRKSAVILGAVLYSALAFLPLTAYSHVLPAPVRQALKQARIPESATGIYVHEVGATQPL